MGMHQGSGLSPLLFVIVMEAISREFTVSLITQYNLRIRVGARYTHCYYTPLIVSIIRPIYSCHFQSLWMILKVIGLIQDLSNAIRRTFVRHFVRF